METKYAVKTEMDTWTGWIKPGRNTEGMDGGTRVGQRHFASRKFDLSLMDMHRNI